MPSEIGFVQNVGVLAHYMFLDKLKTFAEANGYTILRYDTAATDRELIMRAPGLSGTEQIYMGFKCYQSVPSDYYNIKCGAFTGYLAGNSFETQPGAVINSTPAHNNRIDYWLNLNGQRITFVLKVGTPVYTPVYLGKLLPNSAPSQYPYPMVCGAGFAGAPATRFSDATYNMPYVGSVTNLSLRSPGGLWINPQTHPWNNSFIAGASAANNANLRDTETYYPMLPVSLMDATNGIMGELDGIFYISGFNNAVENTTVFESRNYVVFQNVTRTGFTSYFAMRLDT